LRHPSRLFGGRGGWEFKTMFATFYWQGNPSKSLHGWHVSILRSNIKQIIVGKIFVSDI
jgi:hypothetical protein